LTAAVVMRVCVRACDHILTSLQLLVLVEMQLNKLAKSTAVVVHDGLRVAERLQQRIHLHSK